MTTLEAFKDAIARHTPSDGTFSTPLPGVRLIRCSSPTLPMPVIYEPTLCFVAQGRKRAVLGDTVLHYDPASFLVATVGLPVTGTVIEATLPQPYLSVQLDLDRPELGELALKHGRAPASTEVTQGLRLGEMSGPLLTAVTRLIELLDTPEDVEALGPLAMQELLYRLLTGPMGPTILAITQADSRQSQIARAIVWIRAHFREPFRIDDVADLAGMSRSTFHEHFKAVTAMSPLEFRNQLRMQEARRLMVSDGLDAARAGFSVGYESPSQFSRDYSRVFGRAPAQDARRLRVNGLA